jgi:hypothetical protein
MAIVELAREYLLTFLMYRKYCRRSSSVMRYRGLVIVIGELADSANVGFLSSMGEPSELKTLDHSLSEFGHNYPVPFARPAINRCAAGP